jgi:succinyl-diaminopimelate desuccinylase
VSDLTDTTTWLVEIPSVTGDEAAIATAVADRLGATYAPDEIERIGNSVVVGKRTGKPLVLLVGHLDTVPSQGAPPAYVEGDRLFGLGSTDMKGGVAVMLHLMEAPEIIDGPFDVVGVFYDAEEGPSDANGLEPVLEQLDWLSSAELAIVLEPSDSEIQLGCNGTLNATVEFHGKSSHSARPWWGENAVTKAGEWLTMLHARAPEPVIIDGLEFREVMSVTMASGGIARNIIPDRFTLNLNYRFSPERTIDEATQRLMAVCDVADAVTVVDVAPSGPVQRDHPLIARLHEVSGAPFAAKQGWTDVARFGTRGVLGINFGPGETSQAHQADESLRISDLEDSYRALFELLS